MKNQILIKGIFLTVVLFSVSSQAFVDDRFAVMAPGWTFHSPNMNNELLSSPSPSFKGTFTKRGDNLISSMIIIKQPLPRSINNTIALKDWINGSYFEGKAEMVFSTQVKGAEDKGQMFVFKQDQDGALRITFAYAFVKGFEVIILAQATTPESYKEDMKYSVQAMKSVKFIL
ncbi:MAG: hypothetical protein M9899_03950 [Bdellovibrionaceae bacterium]|nr:hypothetical protein [Pseudobdellovibrionaceae bacterium]